MDQRRLGSTDMEVAVLGFGGSEVGYQNLDGERFDRLLGAALDAGLNVIDTAECYGEGESLIGRLAHRRREFYLFTKCGHAAGLPGSDWEAAMLERSIDRSLRRLRTDHVDLLQLHGCSEDVLRRGDVLEVLRRARDAGKTRYVGYSGDGAKAVYAIRTGFFDTLQTSVSLADQEAITLTIPEATRRGMGVIAKRPVANAAWRDRTRPRDAYAHVYWERLQRLGYPQLHQGDLAAQVGFALRFTLAVPGVHVAIVGTTNPDHWRRNAEAAAQGPLPPDAFEAVRARWRAVAGTDWVGQG